MSGRIKIKPKNKDKKPKTDIFKVIEDRFKNMNELRDMIDMDPKKGLVRIRDGAGFREVERGGCLHRNYLGQVRFIYRSIYHDLAIHITNQLNDLIPYIVRKQDRDYG